MSTLFKVRFVNITKYYSIQATFKKLTKYDIVEKFNGLNQQYMKVIGLDEVKKLQDRVILMQLKLEKTQIERRDLSAKLNDIRKRSAEIQDRLHKIKRWEEPQQFLRLTQEDTENVQLEKEKMMQLDQLDRIEREDSTALSNAIRDSHEKERLQAEYTKYWGIILSITGTLIGAALTLMVNTIRNQDLVEGIVKRTDQKMEIQEMKLDNFKSEILKCLSMKDKVVHERNEGESFIFRYPKAIYNGTAYVVSGVCSGTANGVKATYRYFAGK